MSNTEHEPFSPAGDHRLRHVRESLVTPLDVAAYVVALVMVCMPLAVGAFSH